MDHFYLRVLRVKDGPGAVTLLVGLAGDPQFNLGAAPVVADESERHLAARDERDCLLI